MSKICLSKFLVNGIQRCKIAVIGDVMLDRYFYGDVSRISPEAPVPVNKVNKVKSVLGGAANVAANLANLDCQVFIGGVTGEDENLPLLKKLMNDLQIDYQGLVISPHRKTITKLRVIGGQQQMLRLDFEETGELFDDETTLLKRWFLKLLENGIDGVIISDYAKGVCATEFCQWVIKHANKNNIPVLVDPKGNNWDKYKGCDYITPNLKELSDAVGYPIPNEKEVVMEAANLLRGLYRIRNMVVTRSEKGITLVNEDITIDSPATALDVFDVSGAGDTVAATLMACIAGKQSLSDAVYTANKAAGIVVGKVGTYAVHRSELLNNVVYGQTCMKKEALSWDKIANLVKSWKAANETVVFTNGCFDLLHVGHVTYLETARNLGKHLVIGLNSDDSVRLLKGAGRPLVHDVDRARVLAALACVDAVVIFEQKTPEELIKFLRPDVLVKGGDYTIEQVAGREYAKEIKILDFEEGYSTSKIVEKIKSNKNRGNDYV